MFIVYTFKVCTVYSKNEFLCRTKESNVTKYVILLDWSTLHNYILQMLFCLFKDDVKTQLMPWQCTLNWLFSIWEKRVLWSCLTFHFRSDILHQFNNSMKYTLYAHSILSVLWNVGDSIYYSPSPCFLV